MKKIVLIILLFTSSLAYSQWRETTIPRSYTGKTMNISNPSFPTADIGYVISSVIVSPLTYDYAKLHKTTNKGVNWISIYDLPSGNFNSVISLWFINSNTGFYSKFVNSENPPFTLEIYKTNNGGYNWNKIGEINNITHPVIQGYQTDHIPSYSYLKFVNENVGYLCEWTNLYKTTDGGVSWSLIKVCADGLYYLLDIASSKSDNTIFVGGYRSWSSNENYALLYESTNAGAGFITIADGTGIGDEIEALTSITLAEEDNNKYLYGAGIQKVGMVDINNQLVAISDPYTLHNFEERYIKFGVPDRGILFANNQFRLSTNSGINWTDEYDIGGISLGGMENSGDVIFSSGYNRYVYGQQSSYIYTRKIPLYGQYSFDLIPEPLFEGGFIVTDGIDFDEKQIIFHLTPPEGYGGTLKCKTYDIIINSRSAIFYKWAGNGMNTNPGSYSYFDSKLEPLTAHYKTKLKTTTASALSSASNVSAIKDTNGVINYLYESMGGIFYTRSTDNGSTFATEEIVNYHPTEYTGDGNYNACLTEIKPYNLGQPPVGSSSNMASVWERKDDNNIKIRFSTRLYNSPPLSWSAPIDLVTLTSVPANFKANPKIFMVKSTSYQDSILCVLYLKPVNGVNQLWVFGKGRGANNVNQCVISGNNINTFSAVSIMQNYMGNSLNLHIAYVQDGQIKYSHKMLTANEYGPYFETVNPDESYIVSNNTSLFERKNPDITLRNASNNPNNINIQPVIAYQGRQIIKIINQTPDGPFPVSTDKFLIVYRQRTTSGGTNWSGNGQYISSNVYSNPCIEGAKKNNSYILEFSQSGNIQWLKVPLWSGQSNWAFNTEFVQRIDAKFVKGGLIDNSSTQQSIITVNGNYPYTVANESKTIAERMEGVTDEVCGAVIDDNVIYSFNLGSILVNSSTVDFNFSIDSTLDDASDFDALMTSNPFYLNNNDTLVIGRNCFYVSPDTVVGFSEIHYEVDLVNKTTNTVHSVLVIDTVHAEDTIQTEYLDGFIISGIRGGADSFYVKMIVDTVRVDGSDGLDGSGITGGFSTGEEGDFSSMKRYVNFHNMNIINSMPNAFNLYQNFPNPFNPVTTIKYDLPKNSNVTIIIYDLIGREVSRLVNNEFKNAGRYEINWNANNYASGIYFYRITSADFTDVKKMVLIK